MKKGISMFIKGCKKVYHGYLSELFPEKYYHDDGEPIKCPYCGSSRIHFVITDHINHTISEGYDQCGDCGKIIISWAYGSYNPYELPAKMRK